MIKGEPGADVHPRILVCFPRGAAGRGTGALGRDVVREPADPTAPKRARGPLAVWAIRFAGSPGQVNIPYLGDRRGQAKSDETPA